MKPQEQNFLRQPSQERRLFWTKPATRAWQISLGHLVHFILSFRTSSSSGSRRKSFKQSTVATPQRWVKFCLVFLAHTMIQIFKDIDIYSLNIYIYIYRYCMMSLGHRLVGELQGPRLFSGRVENELHGYLKSARRSNYRCHNNCIPVYICLN